MVCVCCSLDDSPVLPYPSDLVRRRRRVCAARLMTVPCCHTPVLDCLSLLSLEGVDGFDTQCTMS